MFLLFLAPFSWGTQKREAAAPKASGCFMGGTCAVQEEPGKQKPRRCRAQEFGPKRCPGKCAAENGDLPSQFELNEEQTPLGNQVPANHRRRKNSGRSGATK